MPCLLTCEIGVFRQDREESPPVARQADPVQLVPSAEQSSSEDEDAGSDRTSSQSQPIPEGHKTKKAEAIKLTKETELLRDFLEARPFLYDKGNWDYKDSRKRSEALAQIEEKVGISCKYSLKLAGPLEIWQYF